MPHWESTLSRGGHLAPAAAHFVFLIRSSEEATGLFALSGFWLLGGWVIFMACVAARPPLLRSERNQARLLNTDTSAHPDFAANCKVAPTELRA
jgi:hypothetical protein